MKVDTTTTQQTAQSNEEKETSMAIHMNEVDRDQLTEAEYTSNEVKLMNSKSLFFGLLTATLALTSLTVIKPAIALPDIPISDAIELKREINELVHKAENRSGFVKGLMESTVLEAKKRGGNVMVFNLSQEYETDIRNTAVFFDKVEYDGIFYGIWIFDKGTFKNKGNAGWMNWAFYGNFTRDGKTVTFH